MQRQNARKRTIPRPITIVDSSSSDDDVEIVDLVRHKKKKCSRKPTDCVNPSCTSGLSPTKSAPIFALTYYKVRKKKYQKICDVCFNKATKYYAKMSVTLRERGSICDYKYIAQHLVVNIDSGTEDLSSDLEEEPLNTESISMINEHLDGVFQTVIKEYNLNFQIREAEKKIESGTLSLQSQFDKDDAKLNEIQKFVDAIRQKIYEPFTPTYESKPTLEIMADEASEEISSTQNTDGDCIEIGDSTSAEEEEEEEGNDDCGDNDICEIVPDADPLSDEQGVGDVVAIGEETLYPPSNLPPPGQAVRPKIRVGDVMFAMRESYEHSWRRAVVQEDMGEFRYIVRFEMRNSRNVCSILTGRQLAYPTPSPVSLDVGVRVIANFQNDDGASITRSLKQRFYSGIIAEPPKAMNKFRYLIFFDDGYTQYVNHKDIRVIYQMSADPWEDTPPESKEFIKKYLKDYPERPMVKLQRGDTVKVEFKKNWWSASVVDVDTSLVKIAFQNWQRTEWMYRGSTRLSPLYKELANAVRRRETGDRVRRIHNVRPNQQQHAPYVEYTHYIDLDEMEDEEDDAVEETTTKEAGGSSTRKPVARKSGMLGSSRQYSSGVTKPKKWKPVTVPGKVILKKITDTTSPKRYVPHECGVECVSWTKYDRSNVYNMGSLNIPMHFGFRRVTSEFNGRHTVSYIAPCGTRIRSIEEMHRYLRITKSTMTVDMFDFDFWVKCLAEFFLDRCNVQIPDISNKKEMNPISCVNYVNSDLPPFTGYMTHREPQEGVNLNLDEEFLCGCDCTDDCQDREKCSCWQLTINGQELIPGNHKDPHIGYHYRRLPERVITGIYECNSRCKCSKVTCLNRVVQHPMSQKLQLFKTEMKGWGIRCLNDIPQGAFICVYVGHLLTEQAANEDGKSYGDEYLAELDYIEVIERMKEDYESDVPDMSDMEDTPDSPGDNEKDHWSRSSSDDDMSCISSDMELEEELNRLTTSQDSEPEIKKRLRKRSSLKKSSEFGSALSAGEQAGGKNEDSHSQPNSRRNDSGMENRDSIRKYFGKDETVYIMDAKQYGNIGRYLNHSCSPNVFVQNVFVDTHDIRFPWVAFFAQSYIPAGSELTWDYHYDVGSVENKVMYCYCGSDQCRGRLL